MTLFEVAGWDIKSQKVQMGGLAKKKEDKSTKKSLQQKGNQSQLSEDVAETSEKDVLAPVPAMSANLTPLQQKMMAKLSGSRFRWINEQLYTTTSDNALKLVKNQPALFDEYHQGFRSQVQQWPENPVNVLVDQFKARTARPINAPGGLPGFANKKIVLADMGCGEAQFALDINNFVKEHNSKKFKKTDKKTVGPQGPRILDVDVHSFDLKKANERITVADVKNVPMKDESCNIVIFCLALMGTNFLDFIEEAYRILAPNGELWIAEIKSRFSESTNAKAKPNGVNAVGEEFVDSLKLLGFYHKKTDNANKMFTRFEFFKPSREIINQRNEKLQKRKKFVERESQKEELDNKRTKAPEGEWLLKPCIYKRR
ncbi:hypothetical protein METBIDRAFT_87206 [Metschnikowia bicuspidata var. bicuspidata NRRL YB-4993]|uniref:Ribosomal RNA-processing protein 8 n=1 Tax=Metschnikowia bicuspidata var. bicuspidata NRRL YB-4993 TaxID=869754 RepID=A0A1A0HAM4_9ASCO|nr:hypothetical protein METBIDRAFT_87206 [Metschnikowia bicuspidata var. bicuspidata NRRL YB-4993]OBA20927.1 hypothetical protein METBIDRAFT_87206 [Metschnikowia bicuspidata var. bicuspidata NRRL YB-4993]